MTLREVYSYCVQFLERNGVDEAEFKALCLACHAAGINNSEYLSHTQDEIVYAPVAKRLWRLKEGEPLQYVLGKWDFYDGSFYVGRGVLIPRPETEELVARCIAYGKTLNAPVIYDLCAGSGCIGVTLARHLADSRVYCIEKSAQAFAYLQKNAAGAENVTCLMGDIYGDFDLPKADIIVSNPPYIPTDALSALQKEVQQEPREALDGGADGLAFYRLINDKWSAALCNNGRLFLEIGEGQGSAVSALLTHFKDVQVHRDLYKNDRIVTAVKASGVLLD